jgi:hypothetical protein
LARTTTGNVVVRSAVAVGGNASDAGVFVQRRSTNSTRVAVKIARMNINRNTWEN